MRNLITSSDFRIPKLIRHLQENCQYKESMEEILSKCGVLSSILRLAIPACQEKSVIDIAKDLCRGEGIQVPEDIKELMNTTIDGLKSSYIDESVVCEKTVRIELSDQNSFLVNLDFKNPVIPSSVPWLVFLIFSAKKATIIRIMNQFGQYDLSLTESGNLIYVKEGGSLTIILKPVNH